MASDAEHTSTHDGDVCRDKVIRLLKYLEEFVRLRTTVTRRIEQYQRDGFVLWFAHLPQTEGCVFPLWRDMGEGRAGVWLEVRKQDLAPVPELLPLLEPWVDVDTLDGSRETPEIRDRVFVEEEAEEWLLADHPEVSAAWQQYLEVWRRWAERNREKAKVQRVYGQLFRAYQLQRRLGEAYEFVLGLGFLAWRTPQQQEVRRHILRAQAELRFDEHRGVLSVHCPPPPDGARLQIEDEFVEPTDRPSARACDEIEGILAEAGDDVWGDGVHNAIRAWGTALHPDLSYSDGLVPHPTCTDVPHLSPAPALILRKRLDRGTLLAYRRIIAQLEDGGPVPFGMLRLVDHLDDPVPGGDGVTADGAHGDRGQEVGTFFPLPSNAEQQRILDTLGRRQGVLVQGPPGTGKSHTIANLICHYLAIGKRVLVTSETPRALRVLKQKLPEEVKPLCVSLLGADTASFSELEEAVSGIGQRHSRWDPAAQRALIAQLAADLSAHRASEARVSKALRDLRESETYAISLCGGAYCGTAAAIGLRVNRERERFGWLTLPDAAPESSPITNDDARLLLEALRRIDATRAAELALPTVASSSLPSPEEVVSAIEGESKATRAAAEYQAHRGDPAFVPMLSSSRERRTRLQDGLLRYVEEWHRLQARPEQWAPRALTEVLTERESLWRTLAQRTEEGLEGLNREAAKADAHQVVLPTDRDALEVLSHSREMLAHLERGGKWTRLGIPAGPARGKAYLRTAVRVDGRPADSAAQLRILVHRLWVEQRLRALWRIWEGVAAAVSSGLETQVAEVTEHLEVVNQTLSLLGLARELSSHLRESPSIPLPNWASDRPDALLTVLQAVDAYARAQEATARLGQTSAALAKACALPGSHHVNQELKQALDRRDIAGWSAAMHVLLSLERDRADYERASECLERLRAGAPGAATALEETPQQSHWDSCLPGLEEAWHWAVASRWVGRRADPTYQQTLVRELAECERRIGVATAHLAAERAWDAFLARLTPRERQSLEAWQYAVRKIGKGTGKQAERYRRDARMYMADCVEAIPAWIVPRYRVAEVLEPRPELFDVVIVDEASQTGIDGLFLYYLGKQTIVVGDHQQISPAGIGLNETTLAELQHRYLQDIPFQTVLGPTSSLYDHAQIRFAGRIVLQEHFRCMPEIIQFSNDLCYAPHGTPLIPLRTYPPNRLRPVVAVNVPGGYQEGKASSAFNREEARSLVAQVVGCLQDDRYRDKTFGVISLLGEAQARLILQMLTTVLGPEEMEKRSIVCGDAYAFQGDERDVIFLSMVSAPNATIGVLSTLAAQQRFNVAASRARDQLWLFHSVEPHDLSATCVRKRLLEYCRNPVRDPGTVLDDGCESDFERDVCAEIRKRGYRVCTQVPAGEQTAYRYRIDLVVEGMETRLAVECDGDQWHGPDRYEKDMARQRQLERAGWQFYRIRAGSFYADRDAALAPLWEELDRLRIRPSQEPAAFEPPAPVRIAGAQAGGAFVQTETGDDEGVPTSPTTPGNGEPESGPSGPDTACPTGPSTAPVPAPSPPQQAAHEPASPHYGRRPAPQALPPASCSGPQAEPTGIGAEDAALVARVPRDDWFALARWAKESEKLTPLQRHFAYDIGRRLRQGQSLTPKQVRFAARTYREATEGGFVPPKSDQTDLFEGK